MNAPYEKASCAPAFRHGPVTKLRLVPTPSRQRTVGPLAELLHIQDAALLRYHAFSLP